MLEEIVESLKNHNKVIISCKGSEVSELFSMLKRTHDETHLPDTFSMTLYNVISLYFDESYVRNPSIKMVLHGTAKTQRDVYENYPDCMSLGMVLRKIKLEKLKNRIKDEQV